MIFNTHSHINDKINNKDELDLLLKECNEFNVLKVACVGYDYISSVNAIKLASLYDNIYAICGLQPEEVNKYDGDLSEFKELFDNEKCIAIGEIGLDYYYGKESKEKQLYYFEKQLKIACKYKKPIAIHCREAHEDLYNLLYKYHKSLDGIILHCYTGSVEMMKRYLKLNAYISISGIVTFKNAITIKEVVKECPLDRLLVETDDPYLTPFPFRGKENHPSYVYYVIKQIAMLKEMDEKEIQDITYNNALRVFHLWRK